MYLHEVPMLLYTLTINMDYYVALMQELTAIPMWGVLMLWSIEWNTSKSPTIM